MSFHDIWWRDVLLIFLDFSTTLFGCNKMLPKPFPFNSKLYNMLIFSKRFKHIPKSLEIQPTKWKTLGFVGGNDWGRFLSVNRMMKKSTKLPRNAEVRWSTRVKRWGISRQLLLSASTSWWLSYWTHLPKICAKANIGSNFSKYQPMVHWWNKSRHILLDGGLMVIYHGTIR